MNKKLFIKINLKIILIIILNTINNNYFILTQKKTKKI